MSGLSYFAVFTLRRKIEKPNVNNFEMVRCDVTIPHSRTTHREVFETCWTQALKQMISVELSCGMEESTVAEKIDALRAEWVPAHFKIKRNR